MPSQQRPGSALMMAVWVSSLLITAHAVAAHGSHQHHSFKHLKSSRRLQQQDASAAAATAAAWDVDIETAAADVQAAAAALLETAEPIPDAPARNDSKKIRAAAVEGTEVEPAGGWQRCASEGGSSHKRAQTERRFQKLVAAMSAADGIAVVAEDMAMRDIQVYMHVITLNKTAGMVYKDQVDAQMRVSATQAMLTNKVPSDVSYYEM
jgi:hypothetical protein